MVETIVCLLVAMTVLMAVCLGGSILVAMIQERRDEARRVRLDRAIAWHRNKR